MDWNDSEDIAVALYENFPDLDPLAVRFTDLHKMVMELEDFDGEADGASESRLEAIQMAWLEEFRDQE